MRNAFLLVILFVVTSSMAFAGDWQEAAGYGLALLQNRYSQSNDDSSETVSQQQPILSRTVATRVSLAPVKYSPIKGFRRWGDSDAQVEEFVSERAYCVAPEIGRQYGVEIMERTGLADIEAESSLRDDPLFDPESFPKEGMGQGASAQILITVTRCSVERKTFKTAIGGGSSRTSGEQQSIEATVWAQARVVGLGLIKISNTAEAKQSAKSISRESGGFGGFRIERGSDAEGGEIEALSKAADKAIIALLQQLMPNISPTAPMRDGWKYDPATGQAIGPMHCPRCGKELPEGANFCPYDGTPTYRNEPKGSFRGGTICPSAN